MSYVATGRALGAVAASVIDQAIAALPACYSPELDNCFNNPSKPSVPNCAVLNAGYDADYDKMQAAVERLPFCEAPPCPVPTIGMKEVLGSGAIGLLLGVVVGMKIK